MAIKSINNTASNDYLILTLLVFGAYLYIYNIDLLAQTII